MSSSTTAGHPPVRIPLAAPNISQIDRQAMSEAVTERTIAYGPRVERFERAIADRVGVPHAVAVNSGTAAMHLALIVSGVVRDDDVLMPTLTYVAPANAVRYVGAHPVFLDVEPSFRQLDVERARAFVERSYRRTDLIWSHRLSGRRLRAIVAIDLLGHPCDLDAVLELAERFGIAVIDDAAEAFGATIRGRPVGSVAPVSVFSFNANKIMTTAGGGILVCHDKRKSDRARSLASHAKTPGSPRYQHHEVGFNYGMATAQAALGLSQHHRFDGFLSRKRDVAERYNRALSDLPAVVPPGQAPWATSTYWLYAIHLPAPQRAVVIDEMSHAGIETRPIFEPMHRVVAHARAEADDCVVAEELSDTGLCLPCSTSITDDEVDEVAQTLRAALERNANGPIAAGAESA